MGGRITGACRGEEGRLGERPKAQSGGGRMKESKDACPCCVRVDGPQAGEQRRGGVLFMVGVFQGPRRQGLGLPGAYPCGHVDVGDWKGGRARGTRGLEGARRTPRPGRGRVSARADAGGGWRRCLGVHSRSSLQAVLKHARDEARSPAGLGKKSGWPGVAGPMKRLRSTDRGGWIKRGHGACSMNVLGRRRWAPPQTLPIHVPRRAGSGPAGDGGKGGETQDLRTASAGSWRGAAAQGGGSPLSLDLPWAEMQSVGAFDHSGRVFSH